MSSLNDEKTQMHLSVNLSTYKMSYSSEKWPSEIPKAIKLLVLSKYIQFIMTQDKEKLQILTTEKAGTWEFLLGKMTTDNQNG